MWWLAVSRCACGMMGMVSFFPRWRTRCEVYFLVVHACNETDLASTHLVHGLSHLIRLPNILSFRHQHLLGAPEIVTNKYYMPAVTDIVLFQDLHVIAWLRPWCCFVHDSGHLLPHTTRHWHELVLFIRGIRSVANLKTCLRYFYSTQQSVQER